MIKKLFIIASFVLLASNAFTMTAADRFLMVAGGAVSAPTTPVISVTPGDTTNQIELTSGGSGATSFDIHWGTTSGSRTNTISSATLPYTHTGRTNGTPYYYSLIAINSGGSTESSEVSGTPRSLIAVTDNFNRADYLKYVAAGSSGTATSGNPSGLGLPTGWAAEDIFVLQVSSQDNVTHSVSAGWTQLYQESSAANLQSSVWWRRAQSGDTVPTVTHTSGNAIGAKITAFRGAYGAGSNQATSPWDVLGSIAHTTPTTLSSSAITPNGSSVIALHLIHGGSNNAGSPSTATPTGIITATYNGFYGGGAGNEVYLTLYYKKIRAVPATTGTAGATSAGTDSVWASVIADLMSAGLGTNWSTPTGQVIPEISANHLYALAPLGVAYWSANGLPAANQYSQLDGGGETVRQSSSADTCYWLHYYYDSVSDDGTNILDIVKVVNGTETTLATIAGQTATTAIRLEATGTLSTLLTAKIGGSTVLTYTDSISPLTSGYFGIRGNGDNGDNYSGGTL